MNEGAAIPNREPIVTDSAARSDRWRLVLGSLILAAIVAVAYAPALHHLPHSDHANFILDTIDCNNFGDLLSHTYSFARTRVLCQGDTQLFRPALFVMLAALQEFVGLRWEWCQALSIALHMIACVLLLTLLERVFRRARPSDGKSEGGSRWTNARSPFTYLPFALAFFFALNYALIEQVIWYHIQGYLVALVLILAAIVLLFRATDAERPTLFLGGAWALTLIAAFTYELGQFFAVCAGLYVVWARWADGRQRWAAGLAFLAIVGIYQGVNHVDRRQHCESYQDDVVLTSIAENACSVATIQNFTRYALYTTVQPFLPGSLFTHSHGKVGVDESLWRRLDDPSPFPVLAHSFDRCQVEHHAWSKGLHVRPSLIVGWVVVGLAASLMLLGAWKLTRPSFAVAALLAGSGLAQACMIVLGRLNMRPGHVTLAYNSHYTYFGLLFSLAVAAVLLAQAQRLRGHRGRLLARSMAGFLVLGLLALGIGSGLKVYRLNAHLADSFHSSQRWLRSLRDFVHAHEHEPDFRFAIAWNCREPMPNYCQIPVPYLFYRRYIDRDHPKYVLWYENRRFVGVPLAEWRKNHAENEPHFCANFVRMTRDQKVFYRDGLYYGVANAGIWAFLASADPKEDRTFPHHTDLQTVLGWIRQNEK
jgi:hypothetical protein